MHWNHTKNWFYWVIPIAFGSTLVASVSGEIRFERDIRPILSDNCFQCHGPDAKKRKAELRLDLEEGALSDIGGYAAVVPGNPAKSELLKRITSKNPEERMPPPDSQRKLDSKKRYNRG